MLIEIHDVDENQNGCFFACSCAVNAADGCLLIETLIPAFWSPCWIHVAICSSTGLPVWMSSCVENPFGWPACLSSDFALATLVL